MSKIYTSCLCTFFFFSINISAQLTVTADRPDGTYNSGEQMNFVVNGGFGTATYVIRYDRGQAPNITEGTIQVNGSANIPFKLDEPGMVFCIVTLNGQSSVCGAAFSPFEIQPFEAAPADFEQFWNGWKSRLATVPINPVLTPLFPDPNVSTDDYRINLGMIDGRRVYGYLTVPKGAGPYPAVITHASFGGNAHLCIPRPEVTNNTGDVISLSIWMHNTQPDQEDFNAYKPEIFNDRDGIYYRYGVLGVIRAIDYIFTMSQFDGSNIGLHGISEGGAMSLLAAGIDDRVKCVASSVFSMGEHTGFKYNRASGFPFFILRGATTWPVVADENVVNATKYYDVVHAAKRYNGPFLGSVGFVDETVMPATNFSAYNQLEGSTVWIQKVNGTHAGSTAEFNEVKYDFFRKHLGVSGSTGYVGDAGPDQNISSGSVNLEGKIYKNGEQIHSLPVAWKKVSGPGQVVFSNPFSALSSASFSLPGEYILRFSATDESRLNSEQAIFTIADHLKINTAGGINPCARDTSPPTAGCKNFTLELDAAGTGFISSVQVENNSFDDCTSDQNLNFLVSQTAFTCADIGQNTIELTVMDQSGNSSVCNSIVEVIENTPPNAGCKNQSLLLDAAGTAILSPIAVNNGSFDNCTGSADLVYTLSKTQFDCSDVSGAVTVEMSVTDAAGNVSKCFSTVTVSENIAPTAVCEPLTVELNSSGNGSLTPQEFGGNSFDNCTSSNDLRLTINRLNFGCWDVGILPVTLTVIDNAGNAANCTADITIRESSPPTAFCRDINTMLDASGISLISGAEINAGSWDNCTPSSELTTTVDRSVFNCSDLGTTKIQLTVTDKSGNTSVCESTVNVLDREFPIANCRDLTLVLDANGEGIITPEQINSGSFDNCPVGLKLELDRTGFDCTAIGIQQVNMSISDVSGNTSVCSAMIDVQDVSKPIAACKDVLVTLDSNGKGVISASDIDSGSSDNCSADLIYSLSKTEFTCADAGAGTVELTVTDESGNSSTCSAFVQINETEPPIAICQNTTIELSAQGIAQIIPSVIENGSFDNCTPSSNLTFVLDRNELKCSDLGLVTVTMSVTDASGNSDNCQSEIMVLDVTPPVPVCNDITVSLDSFTVVEITPEEISLGAFDNCTPSVDLDFFLSKNSFTIDDLGLNSVDLTVADESGNIAGCSALVLVEKGISSSSILSDSEIEFNVYPNPVSERVWVRFRDGKGNESLRILNHLGQTVSGFSTQKTGNSLIEIELENLLPGVYFVLVFGSDGQAGIEKLIVK